MDAAFLARELDVSEIVRARPPSREAQRSWLLHGLYAHEAEGGPPPAAHPDRRHACPGWPERLRDALAEGLVEAAGGKLGLTDRGRELVLNARTLHPDGLPGDPPFRIHLGAIATGKAVQEDPKLFERLRHLVRTTCGVEMEGAAIGEVAARFERRAIVVKAVSDHADQDKDDSFRAFACRASAEVLLAFLRKHMEPSSRSGHAAAAGVTPSYPDARTRDLGERLEAARERARRLRDHGADAAEVEREILDLRRQLREGGQLQEGDSLDDGRYLLLRRLGRGGFAIVWEALDRERGARVAVKVLLGELVRDPVRHERFFRGARLMAGVDHDAVVRVLEPRGEDGGYHYFVMELVEGGDLRQAVLQQRVGARDVLPIVLRVGSALTRAHQLGLVHRDVKPANVLLTTDGAPWLTDFDLVGAATTTAGTHTGALGTFLYAAPELMQRPQDATARADVYGLGMIAVFALRGEELTLEVVRRADAVIDGLPCGDATKAALKRAVEWDEADRFASVEELCQALLDAATPADAAHAMERLLSWSRGEEAVELALALADVRVRLGDREGAVRALVERLAVEPGHAALRGRLRALHEEAGAWVEVVSLLAEDAEHAAEPADRLRLHLEAVDVHVDRRNDPGAALDLLFQVANGAPEALRSAMHEAIEVLGRKAETVRLLRPALATGAGEDSPELAAIRHRIEQARAPRRIEQASTPRRNGVGGGFRNWMTKEDNLPIAYYGALGSGRAKTLRYIHERSDPSTRSKLIVQPMEHCERVQFDFTPQGLGEIHRFKVRLHLRTVPIQEWYDGTRKLLLKSICGIVFVADSREERLDANIVAMESLQRHLGEQGYSLDSMPLAIQYNKRDLPGVLPVEDLRRALNPWLVPDFETVATTGVGVFDTLKAVAKVILTERRLER